MTKIDVFNGAAVIAAMVLSGALTFPVGLERLAPSSHARESTRTSVVDATGTRVDVVHFQRIASASSIADQLLVALCEPDRIVAFTRYGATHSAHPHRYVGKPTIGDLSEIEAILALQPDLVLVSNVADPKRVTRLREAGIVVFDLGPMRGVSSLADNIVAIGKLVGAPERGEALLKAFTRRIERIASGLPPSARKRGMYLSVYGGHLYGGTRGTSYGDVLRYAGIEDVAASAYANWPEYTSERVLALDPELLVTNEGMGAMLCSHPGLSRLKACSAGWVVEMDPDLLGDPGLEMLDAAESVYAKVYENESEAIAAQAGSP